MIKILKTSVIAGVIVVLCNTPAIFASRKVSAIQSGCWSLNNSPYIVTGNIIIPNGLILMIEQGVVVKFAGNFFLKVEGGLIAKGSRAKPIVFTSMIDKQFGSTMRASLGSQAKHWKGIEFSDESDDYLNVLNHCIVRYSSWGIRCSKAYPLLTNIVLAENDIHTLKINNQDYTYQPGEIFSPITRETRPAILPLPEPVYETDMDEVKRLIELKKLKIEQARLIAKQDSIRKANKTKPLDSKTGMLSLDREFFDQLNVQSINELIGYLPGFLNIATIWSGYQLTSRGIPPTLANNRFLLQVNKMPFYEPVAMRSYTEFIPLDGIERVEIERGISSAQFNHNGVTGSANFIPQYNDARLINKSKIEFGEYGTKKLTAFLGVNRNATYINLSTQFLNHAGYWRNFSQGHVGPMLRQKYAGDLYNFSAFVKRPTMNFFASYFEHEQFQLGIIPQLQFTSPTQRRGLVLSLNKTISINPQLHATISGSYVRSYERSEMGNTGSFHATEFNDADCMISKGQWLSASLLSQYKKSPYLATLGITVSRYIVDPLFGVKTGKSEIAPIENEEFASSISEYETTGFVQFGYNFSPFIGFVGKTSLNFKESAAPPDLSMDAKLIYNPFSPFDSYIRYSRTFRVATLLERRIFLPGLFYGTSNLKSEKFEQWEWSTDFHIHDDLKLGFVAYYFNSSDIIQLSRDNYFINSEKSSWTTGCEFIIQGKLTDKIFVLSNASYNDTNASGWLFPKWKVNGLTRIHWLKKLSTIITFQYLSRLNTERKFGAYYLMHLSLAYQVLPKIRIMLNEFDLLDQHPENPEYIRGDIPAIPVSPGRTFFITITIE